MKLISRLYMHSIKLLYFIFIVLNLTFYINSTSRLITKKKTNCVENGFLVDLAQDPAVFHLGMPKGCFIILQRHLLNHIHCFCIYDTQKLGRT